MWVGDHELTVSGTVPGAQQSLKNPPVVTVLGHQPMALALITQQPGYLFIRQIVLRICHVPGAVLGAADTARPDEMEPFPPGTYISGKYYLASPVSQALC